MTTSRRRQAEAQNLSIAARTDASPVILVSHIPRCASSMQCSLAVRPSASVIATGEKGVRAWTFGFSCNFFRCPLHLY